MPSITRPRDCVHVRPRRVHARVHVCDLSLHKLEGADRLIELLAIVHVLDGVVECGLHQTAYPT